MTPKEKAKELINKFNHFHDTKKKEYIIYQDPTESIRCALIAVDEILDFMFLSEIENSFWINYYNKVKQEIEKL